MVFGWNAGYYEGVELLASEAQAFVPTPAKVEHLKTFVVDYTVPNFEPLMEYESSGFYGNSRLLSPA